jgi:hypothetical protein
VGREKLTDDIDVSVNIYADLFEITTDHLQQFVINISATHDEKKTQWEGGREREREREKPWDMAGFVSGTHINQGLSNAH